MFVRSRPRDVTTRARARCERGDRGEKGRAEAPSSSGARSSTPRDRRWARSTPVGGGRAAAGAVAFPSGPLRAVREQVQDLGLQNQNTKKSSLVPVGWKDTHRCRGDRSSWRARIASRHARLLAALPRQVSAPGSCRCRESWISGSTRVEQFMHRDSELQRTQSRSVASTLDTTRERAR